MSTYAPSKGPVTRKAEQKARSTGKLHPLVDPAEYGVIRPSRKRLELQDSGLFELTVGTPMPVETRVDTTGSMGGNVDVALRVLPDAYELCSSALPGYDVHMSTGIFGDVGDNFPLCRPQFEAVADKIVHQMTLMVPERAGGDKPEDPHYGLFGAAYLTKFYINRIGLKSYDFTVSDAPARDRLSVNQLTRIFGKDVFDLVAENGFQIDKNDLPTTQEVVQDLLDRAHAFFLQVGHNQVANRFWTDVYGEDRVIWLPTTELLPQVQAVIIGLTEGTFGLSEAEDFLASNNLKSGDIQNIMESIANIPLAVQQQAEYYDRVPVAGDLFREKLDLWPVDPSEVIDELAAVGSGSDGPEWL